MLCVNSLPTSDQQLLCIPSNTSRTAVFGAMEAIVRWNLCNTFCWIVYMLLVTRALVSLQCVEGCRHSILEIEIKTLHMHADYYAVSIKISCCCMNLPAAHLQLQNYASEGVVCSNVFGAWCHCSATIAIVKSQGPNTCPCKALRAHVRRDVHCTVENPFEPTASVCSE